jgi:hypothetical protein
MGIYAPACARCKQCSKTCTTLLLGCSQWLGSAEEARALTQKAIALLGETEILKERMQIIEELGD